MTRNQKEFYRSQGYVLDVPRHKVLDKSRKQDARDRLLETLFRRLHEKHGKEHRAELLFLSQRNQLTTHELTNNVKTLLKNIVR